MLFLFVANTAVLERTGSADMFTIPRIRRLRWAGLVLLMGDEESIPQALTTQRTGTRIPACWAPSSLLQRCTQTGLEVTRH